MNNTNMNGACFLPDNWAPTSNDVVIGRGMKVYAHTGNQKLRTLVRGEVESYSNAKNRAAKSVIIARVFRAIRCDTSIGFVKKDTKTRRYFVVEDTSAKITIAQYFRDALSHGYKSSKQYKQQLRDALKRSVSDAGPVRDSMFAGSSSSFAAGDHGLKRSSSMGNPCTGFGMGRSGCGVDLKDKSIYADETPSYYLKLVRSSFSPTDATSALQEALQSASDLLEDDDFEWFHGDMTGEPAQMIEESNLKNLESTFCKQSLANLFDVVASCVDLSSDPFEPVPIRESRVALA